MSSTTFNQEESMPTIQSTDDRPTSAPPDLETNSILNSVFLSHLTGESRRLGNIQTNNNEVMAASSSNVGTSSTQPTTGTTQTNVFLNVTSSSPTSSSNSVELDLERLICDTELQNNNNNNQQNNRLSPQSSFDVLNSKNADDIIQYSHNVTQEQLLVTRLAQSRGVALPNLEHIPTDDFPTSATNTTKETSESKPSLMTALLRQASESGISTAAHSNATGSPTKAPPLSTGHSLTVLPHPSTMWNSQLDATTAAAAAAMRNYGGQAKTATIVGQLEESMLLQQYRQQQLLNLQMRVAAMGTTAASPYVNQGIGYGTMQSTSSPADVHAAATAELFMGLRSQSDVPAYPSLPQAFSPNGASAYVGLGHSAINHTQHSLADKMALLSRIDAEELVRSNAYVGYVYALAKKDQAGCRVLQKKLDDGDMVHINQIFGECLEHLTDLMTDPFGNYLCQKLMEVVTDEQLGQLLDRVARDIPRISLNMHGTRASQALVERVCKTNRVHIVIDALRGHVVSLVKDLNGNHVIQKCLTTLGPSLNQFIYDDLVANCVEVAVHRHGCCVLQRSIDSATPEQRHSVIEGVRRNALQLVQDAFGNYVVQYVLDLKQDSINDSVTDMLLGNVTALSKQKFASNVVEKCLVLGSERAKSRLIGEILNDGPQRVRDLLLDPFGNYVVQRALHVSREPQFSRLIDVIRGALPQLRQTPSGKRIALKLTKEYPLLGQQTQQSSNIPQFVSPTAVDFARLQQLAGHDSFSGLSSTQPDAQLLAANPYFALNTARLSNGLLSPSFYPAAFCSTADLQAQLRPGEFGLPLDHPSFPHPHHHPLGIPAPLGGVVLNSPSLQAMQEFSRFHQQQQQQQTSTANPSDLYRM